MKEPASAEEQVESFTMADGITLRATRIVTGSRRVVLVSPGIFMSGPACRA